MVLKKMPRPFVHPTAHKIHTTRCRQRHARASVMHSSLAGVGWKGAFREEVGTSNTTTSSSLAPSSSPLLLLLLLLPPLVVVVPALALALALAAAAAPPSGALVLRPHKRGARLRGGQRDHVKAVIGGCGRGLDGACAPSGRGRRRTTPFARARRCRRQATTAGHDFEIWASRPTKPALQYGKDVVSNANAKKCVDLRLL